MEPPRLIIAYGSETGVAQDAALALYNFARSHRLPCRFGSLDDVGLEALTPPGPGTTVLVAACSTTGQGDPPGNMLRFWRAAMSRRLAPGSLSDNRLRFALVGFGDSSYLQYNFVAKKLHRRLEMLGAGQLCPLALANDQDELGPEQAFRPFADEVSGHLIDVFGVRCACVGSCLDAPLKPLFRVRRDRRGEPPPPPPLSSCRLPAGFRLARVLANRRVTAADHFQDTRMITLAPATPAGDFHRAAAAAWADFQPGDALQVLPSNSDAAVAGLLGTLAHLDPAARLTVSQADPNFPPPPDLPEAASLAWLLTHYFDIACVPRRSFFETLRRVARGEGDSDVIRGEGDDDDVTNGESDGERLEMEIERLAEFVRSVDELAAYCHRPRRTLSEALRDFPASARRIGYADLFDLMKPMQPRSFSIASAPAADQLDLLVAVVKYRSKLMSEQRLGLCSNFLADRCPPGRTVPVRIQAGTLRAPPLGVPLILVGPGTGIAPFRGLVQLRYGAVCEGEAKTSCGPDGAGGTKTGTGSPEGAADGTTITESSEGADGTKTTGSSEGVDVTKTTGGSEGVDGTKTTGGSAGAADGTKTTGSAPSQQCAETLVFFGCRHPDKDFYFASEWREWLRRGLRLHVAHSRPTEDGERRYVQDRILERGQEVCRALLDGGGVVMVAGNATAMPKQVLAAFQTVLTQHGGLDDSAAFGLLADWQKCGRYQMETWS